MFKSVYWKVFEVYALEGDVVASVGCIPSRFRPVPNGRTSFGILVQCFLPLDQNAEMRHSPREGDLP